ncbi:hypothetical protein Pst134EB_016691 [Puccinia striiformis f. sp. tritici]|nr:hypothetical protein Pst134EB_016691 [Puccinia striiformis f. sp. tritici]
MPPKQTTNAQKRALLLKGKGSSTTPKKKAETVEEVLTTQSHLKREDYQIIINWLRNKKNFEHCHGYDKALPVGRPVKADKKKGIKTIEAKLDNMCPLYAEMYKLVNQKPDVNPLCRVDAEDSEEISDSNDDDSSSSSNKSSDDSDSVMIEPSLRDPKKIKRTQTAADLDGEILPGQSGQSEVVNGDLFRPEEEHQQDCNDLGETWGLEEEEQQSDCLPSGDEILNPQSKSVPKGNVVQTASKDVNEDEPNDSPRKKSGSCCLISGTLTSLLFVAFTNRRAPSSHLVGSLDPANPLKKLTKTPEACVDIHNRSTWPTLSSVAVQFAKLVWIDNLIRDRLRRPISKRKRKHSSKLTPAELAMDDPTEEEESDEIYSPSKKKAAQKKKHQTPSTPAERAMDEDSDEDDDNTPPPKTSPSKGKRRASNSKNINPKSHSGPNSVASPFLAFEEYAKKKEDSMSLCPFTPVLNNVVGNVGWLIRRGGGGRNKVLEQQGGTDFMQHGSWCGKAVVAEISRTRQRSGGINGNIKDNNSGINTATAATGGAQRAAAFSTVWRRHQPAAAFSTAWRQSTAAVAFTMAAAFSTAWRRHQPAEHGSSSMAAAFSTAWWRHQPAEHGMAEASTCGARHGGGINRRRHQPAEHGMAEASTGGARHGGGINRRSTAWRRHQPAEHGMAEASTGRARHGGGINRWSTAWRRHQPAEHGMAAASTGGAGRRQR